MNLVRLNPWTENWSLGRGLRRFFDEPFLASLPTEEDDVPTSWHPRADIIEKDNEFVVSAELPGVDRDHIGVELKDNILTLSGERKSEEEIKEESYTRRERIFGRFERSFHLPENVNGEKINAEYKDGILTIRIPKPEEVKPRQITVH